MSYKTIKQPLFGFKYLSNFEGISVYDSVDEMVLEDYSDFLLAATIFSSIKESSASEHSSRMTAMGSATKNAGTLMYLHVFR